MLKSNVGLNPIYIKVIGKSDTFYIYLDKYDTGDKIKSQISEIKNIQNDYIRLHYKNKRVIEEKYTLNDQEVGHKCTLYVVFKSDISDFENVVDLLPSN